jgi:acetoin utilization protein AcuC
MIQTLPSSIAHDLLHAGNPVSKHRTFATSKGTLFLQQFSPPALVERLRADDGLRAFARHPEGEYRLLLKLARNPECALALAYTESGEIVGQVTLAPADAWCQNCT